MFPVHVHVRTLAPAQHDVLTKPTTASLQEIMMKTAETDAAKPFRILADEKTTFYKDEDIVLTAGTVDPPAHGSSGKEETIRYHWSIVSGPSTLR